MSPLDTPLYAVCREWVAATTRTRSSSRRSAMASPTPTTCARPTARGLRILAGEATPTAVLHEGVHGRDERVHTADLGYAARFHIEACMAFSRRTGE